MDTTDIRIKQPLEQMAAYTNRKAVCAVKLQAVFDDKKKIIDMSGGWPGSVHDSRVFQLSSLSRLLDEVLQGSDYHLLADKGFPLTFRVITPYRHRRNLTRVYRLVTHLQSVGCIRIHNFLCNLQEQRNYNRLHSIQRSLAEHGFGLLKGKLRKLKYVDITNLDYMPDIIAAAVVLHNFVIDVEADEFDSDYSDDSAYEDSDEDEARFGGRRGERDAAENRRNRIANSL